MANIARRSVVAAVLASGALPPRVYGQAAPKAQPGHLPLQVFADVLGRDEAKALAALKRMADPWRESSAALLIEMVYRIPSQRVLLQAIALIEKQTAIAFNGDVNPWYEWLWQAERPVHPDAAQFKSLLYSPIDPRFAEYFDGKPAALIRLDEIRWGGVRRDGIPPLRNPKMLAVKDASWLADDDIVFGVAIRGEGGEGGEGADVRAYPKRILAWHEMFTDKIAGREMAGVYCTLCGALVLYDVTAKGVQHTLGTSGFLYRSNKLMYDQATKSMWSTLTGSPVLGALVNKGIELQSLFVVTTTWKEWRNRHPGTQVLSLDTGHRRDYDEGVAYRDYFATDRLMFNVPKPDSRLPNKAEVLALRTTRAGGDTLAIAADLLARQPVYAGSLAGADFVVLTDASGANRVYDATGVRFATWDKQASVTDSQGGVWKMDEAQLTSPSGVVRLRQSAHRAFWFGWHAAFPGTRLVQ